VNEERKLPQAVVRSNQVTPRYPWRFLLIGVAGWINRSQKESIESLWTENQIPREIVGKRRILLNNEQRRRLAVIGNILGLQRLRELAGIATPDDWAVMFILAQEGQTYARLRFNIGPGGSLEIPVAVDFSCEFSGSDQAAWKAEYEHCVLPPQARDRLLLTAGPQAPSRTPMSLTTATGPTSSVGLTTNDCLLTHDWCRTQLLSRAPPSNLDLR